MFLYEKFHGLVDRTVDCHPVGPGSIPGTSSTFFFIKNFFSPFLLNVHCKFMLQLLFMSTLSAVLQLLAVALLVV